MNVFSVNLKTYRQLLRFYKDAPRQFLFAAKGMLSMFAFEAREEQIKQVQKTMTVRNLGFIKSRIRYQNAKGNNIDNIYSMSGSIVSPRFTGWIEQQTGKKADRSRTQSLIARGEDWTKQVKGTARMKSSNVFFDPESEMEGKNLEQKYAAAISGMRKGIIKKRNFLIRKKLGGRMRTLKRGLWMMRRRMLYRLQTFDPHRVQPKRNPWHTTAINNMTRRINLQREWSKQITRVLNFRK